MLIYINSKWKSECFFY